MIHGIQLSQKDPPTMIGVTGHLPVNTLRSSCHCVFAWNLLILRFQQDTHPALAPKLEHKQPAPHGLSGSPPP